jgi:hypothetical protein
MNDQEKRLELKRLEDDLRNKGLSRREFINRVKGLGLGFGAAFVLGIKHADAFEPGNLEQTLDVKSTSSVVDDIIQEARPKDPIDGVDQNDMARYARFYRRGFARYARYARYARVYPRYGRAYGRVYGRVIRR